MAVTYTNIENGESALSVRNKINNLGSAVVDIDKITSQLDQTVKGLNQNVSTINQTVNTMNQTVTQLDSLKNVFLYDLVVPKASWKADSTYKDYPYKASVTTTVNAGSYFPLIFFAPTEQQSGNYCVGSESNGDTIAIWCKEIPANAITIPEILLIGKSTMTANNGLTTAF